MSSDSPLHVSVISAASESELPAGPLVLRSSRAANHRTEIRNATADTLDDLWRFPESTFPDWRDQLISRLHAAADDGHVIYVVPGHPLLGDATVQHLIALDNKREIALELYDEPLPVVLSDLLSSAIGAVTFIDWIHLKEASDAAPFASGLLPVNRNQSVVVTNVAGAGNLASICTWLRRAYGVDSDVMLASMLGRSVVVSTTLAEAPEFAGTYAWYLVVPPAVDDTFYRTAEDLQHLVARLRAPGGCPWDREQTNESLKRNLIEEAYELLDAIESGDSDAMREELGDLILQALMHSQIAEEDGHFVLEDVLDTLIRKLMRRHPHVFANVDADDAFTVVKNWDEIKREERAEKADGELKKQPLGDVPVTLPSIMRAQSVLKRARRLGLEQAELDEHRDSARASSTSHTGDAELLSELLTVVTRASERNVDLEDVLRRWTRSFEHSITESRSEHERS